MKGPVKGRKKTIKYFEPSTGLTWAGVGARPTWVREDLAVRPEDSDAVRVKAAALRASVGTPPPTHEVIKAKLAAAALNPNWEPSVRELRFVENYAKDRNATRAAIRSGYHPSSAANNAHAILNDPRLRPLVDAEIDRIAKVAELEVVDVLREWALLATADPAKIIQTRKVNCRHCWGEGHEYQWSPREYAMACDRAAMADPTKPPPNCVGGFGWRQNSPPNPECPECCGEGTVDVLPFDMNSLGPAERKLVAGVKQTSAGLEIKFRDQDAALDKLAKWLGMFVERKEITGKDGAPLVPTSIIVMGPEE